jgi:chromosome segregation ATPase
MIKNERQYRITKTQLEEFEEQLRSLRVAAETTGVHPRIAQAQRDAVLSQLEELREGIDAYEALQSGHQKVRDKGQEVPDRQP